MAFRSPLTLSRILVVPTASMSLLLACQQQRNPHLPLFQPFSRGGGGTLRCDAPSASRLSTQTQRSSSASGLDARVVKQISSGSLIGLVCGAVVAYLSKPLAILMGVFIAGVQFLEYKGIHLVPYGTLQRYFKSINLKSAIQDDPAFKVAFGVTFALAGFGSL